MSTLRRLLLGAATATATVLAVGVAAGTAHGAPAPAAPTAVSTASADGTHITTTVHDASVTRAADGGATIVDRDGHVIQTLPTSVSLNGIGVPMRTTVSADHRSATSTPVLTDQVRAALAAGMHPASAKKDRAYAAMIGHIQNGWNRGGNVATAVGALAGLIIGCILIVGCIWGAGVGAAIGAAVGINNGDPQAGQSVLTWINTP